MEGSAKDITARKKIEEGPAGKSGIYKDPLRTAPLSPISSWMGRPASTRIAMKRRPGSMDMQAGKRLSARPPYDVSYPTQYDGSSSAEAGPGCAMKVCWAEGSCVFGWKHQRPNGTNMGTPRCTSCFSITRGKPFMQFTLQDITEHKRVVEALRESEAKYRDLFENAVEGIYQTTPGGTIYQRQSRSCSHPWL